MNEFDLDENRGNRKFIERNVSELDDDDLNGEKDFTAEELTDMQQEEDEEMEVEDEVKQTNAKRRDIGHRPWLVSSLSPSCLIRH